MTFEPWHKVQEEDILHKVNEAQAIFSENKKQNETNKIVSEAILQEPNISKMQLEAAIKNIFNKEFKTHQNKEQSHKKLFGGLQKPGVKCHKQWSKFKITTKSKK